MSIDPVAIALQRAKEHTLNAITKSADEGTSDAVLNFAKAYTWLEHPESPDGAAPAES